MTLKRKQSRFSAVSMKQEKKRPGEYETVWRSSRWRKLRGSGRGRRVEVYELRCGLLEWRDCRRLSTSGNLKRRSCRRSDRTLEGKRRERGQRTTTAEDRDRCFSHSRRRSLREDLQVCWRRKCDVIHTTTRSFN